LSQIIVDHDCNNDNDNVYWVYSTLSLKTTNTLTAIVINDRNNYPI